MVKKNPNSEPQPQSLLTRADALPIIKESQRNHAEKTSESIVETPQSAPMTREEAIIYAKSLGITKLYENSRLATHIETLYEQKSLRGDKPIIPGTIDYDWNVHEDKITHPNREGKKCCADMVSDILGLKGKEGEHGRSDRASVLAARLMEANESATGNAGIVFGFENFREGDALIWSEKDRTRITHIGLVRGRLTIDNQEFIVIQHDELYIQTDIVPVHKGTSVSGLNKKIRDPEFLAQQNPKDAAMIRELFQYRNLKPSTVRIRSNNGYYGDRSQDNEAAILFAIRTSTLTVQPNTT